jgi:hypothetical protein
VFRSVDHSTLSSYLRKLRTSERRTEVLRLVVADLESEGADGLPYSAEWDGVGSARAALDDTISTADQVRHELVGYFMDDSRVPPHVSEALNNFRRHSDLGGIDVARLRSAAPADSVVREVARHARRPKRQEYVAGESLHVQRALLSIATETYDLMRGEGDPSAQALLSGEAAAATPQATELINDFATALATVSHLSRYLPPTELVPTQELTAGNAYAGSGMTRMRIGLAASSARPSWREKLVDQFADARNRPPYIAELFARAHSRQGARSQVHDRTTAPESLTAGIEDRDDRQNLAILERDRLIGEFTTAAELFRHTQGRSSKEVVALLSSNVAVHSGHISDEEADLLDTFDRTVAALESLESFMPPPTDRHLGLLL